MAQVKPTRRRRRRRPSEVGRRQQRALNDLMKTIIRTPFKSELLSCLLLVGAMLTASLASSTFAAATRPRAGYHALSVLQSRSASRSPLQLHQQQQTYSEPRRFQAASSYQDLAAADQLDEPTSIQVGSQSNPSDRDSAPLRAPGLFRSGEQSSSSPQLASSSSNNDDSYALDGDRGEPHGGVPGANVGGGGGGDDEDDEAMEANRHEAPERNIFMQNHNSHLRAMRDLFERRQLNHHQAQSNHQNNQHALGQSSQELSPISIGLDPGSPFSMPPFAVVGDGGSPPPPPPPMLAPHPKPHMSAGPDGVDQAGGPALPFGLGPLPHLLGFQSGAFDGPQRGDQSAHSNHHASASSQSVADPELGLSQKIWPKIFRFTDGRINLSDFEKQKKIRLSNKNQHGENHIESAPIMFDGRQLKRKSFLILHGGVFPGNR